MAGAVDVECAVGEALFGFAVFADGEVSLDAFGDFGVEDRFGECLAVVGGGGLGHRVGDEGDDVCVPERG